MNRLIAGFLPHLFFSAAAVLLRCPTSAQPGAMENIWISGPRHIPYNTSVDAPLQGNGDLTVSIGMSGNCLRFYLSKNDFWRFVSKGNNLSGPRVVGYVDLIPGNADSTVFSARQLLVNGYTACTLKKGDGKEIKVCSWVSATENILFIELSAVRDREVVQVKMSAPENRQAILKTGSEGDILWLTRSFSDSVDIVSEVAAALKVFSQNSSRIILQPGRKVMLAVCVESIFGKKEPLNYVSDRVKRLTEKETVTIRENYNNWWNDYWSRSSVFIDDPVLLKSWYQGLYTMASCSRDLSFPPGLFGWTTTDSPAWNGDYHLNYNFQAPFYSLCSSNRIEQSAPHDSPLLHFMKRGEWYARNVTQTRGILYPVGIGPMGIEVTRDFPDKGYRDAGFIEKGGLFFGQRSNASYGLVNMAQRWRCTRDTAYGRKIYHYTLGVVDFWEDYLKYENGRYVIYGDAIHEGSGADKNPVLSLGLIRNAFDLVTDLARTLKLDEDRLPQWEKILNGISDFPLQEKGGKTVFRYTEEGISWFESNGLGIQHIYPSNGITPCSSPELLTIARNTVDVMQRWHDMNTSSSFFVAAARVGYDREKILQELHSYALNTCPNGFQLNNPHGIENSCTVTNTLNELFCMSAGHVIRVFESFPTGRKAEFQNLRAWDAFLVSAKLTDGSVHDLKIVSEKGMTCNIINPWPGKKIRVVRNGMPAEVIAGTECSFNTSPGETIELNPF